MWIMSKTLRSVPLVIVITVFITVVVPRGLIKLPSISRI